MIKITHKGSFNNTERFMNRVKNRRYLNVIDSYAQKGVQALMNATPKDSKKTAASWSYEIESDDRKTVIYFVNDNEVDGVNVAVLLLYGHGTRNGGYVEGIDFVSPALRPVFQEIADKVWKEVTK